MRYLISTLTDGCIREEQRANADIIHVKKDVSGNSFSTFLIYSMSLIKSLIFCLICVEIIYERVIANSEQNSDDEWYIIWPLNVDKEGVVYSDDKRVSRSDNVIVNQ